MLDLTGRTVVVTGGNRGIGLGLARGVARAGDEAAFHTGDSIRIDGGYSIF